MENVKNNEIRSADEVCMVKINFEYEFCICKGDNPLSYFFIYCNFVLLEYADVIFRGYSNVFVEYGFYFIE